MKKYSLTTRKLGASATIAFIGTMAMIMFPYQSVIYTVGITSMAFILTILLFGKSKEELK